MSQSNPDSSRAKKRLAMLVNTVAPYRLPIYTAFAREFDMLLLHGGNEANRSWLVDTPGTIKARKVLTLQVRRKKYVSDGVPDTRYIHFNIGLLWWLPASRPDVIVSNEMGSRTILSFLWAKLLGVPLWIWWEGTPYTERGVLGQKLKLRRFLARHVNRWTSFGDGSTQYLRELGIPQAHILQVQNCVPEKNFQKAASSDEPWLADAARPVLLTVGQLIDRKGIDLLIAACGRLAERGHNFTLIIVGQGPRRSDLENQARSLGLANVHFLDHQTQERLNTLYRRANVMVFSTLEDVWGLVVNEAILAGCPVLCSRYAGCAHDLLTPENIFDPLSPPSFDHALDAIFDGTLQPPDTSRLMSCDEVSRRLVMAVKTDRASGVTVQAEI